MDPSSEQPLQSVRLFTESLESGRDGFAQLWAGEESPQPGELLLDDLFDSDFDGALGQAAPSAGQAAARGAFKCLDASHGAGCVSCLPAPDISEAASYELRGDAGRRNGEKRVKAALLRTREWHAAPERESAACAAVGAGMEHLASALRAKRSTGLRKAELFFLLHHWRYASELWADRRASAPPRRARSAKLAAPPAPSPTAAADVAALLDSTLWPALAVLRARLGGEAAQRAASAAAQEGGALLAHTRTAACAAIGPIRLKMALVSEFWAALAAAASEVARELEGLTGPGGQAHRTLRSPRRVMALLAVVQTVPQSMGVMPTIDAEGALAAISTAWQAEVLGAVSALLTAVLGASAALARCWQQCNAREYLEFEQAVADWLTLAISAAHAGFAYRCAWLEELAGEKGSRAEAGEPEPLGGAASEVEKAALFPVARGLLDDHGLAAMLARFDPALRMSG